MPQQRPSPAPRRRSLGDVLRGRQAPRPNPYDNLHPFGGARRRSLDHGNNHKAVFLGYDFVKSLAPGGMSDAINLVKKNGKLFIEKRIAVSGTDGKLRAETEINVLKRISRHKNRNLCQFFKELWGPRDRSVSVIIEYCDAGTLSDKLDKHKKQNQLMPEAFLWHLFLGLANALAFLHAGIEDAIKSQQGPKDWNPICHLDLKPANIFLSNTDNRGIEYPRIVVGDFGCAVTASQVASGIVNRHQRPAGTPAYDAPEANRKFGIDCDNWQIGAAVHTCARLLHKPDRQMLRTGRSCGSKYSDHLNITVSMATRDDPKGRYSATKIVREAVRALDSMGVRYR